MQYVFGSGDDQGQFSAIFATFSAKKMAFFSKTDVMIMIFFKN
jgi:hypothetical protein